jgi:hypothetical protein
MERREEMKTFRQMLQQIREEKLTYRRTPRRKTFKDFITDQNDGQVSVSKRSLTENEIRSAINQVLKKRLIGE